MKLLIYDPRVLALDLRHRRFGFAVFEGHKRLLDWGVRVYPATGDQEAAIVQRKLANLIRLSGPSFIVIKEERWMQARSNDHMRNIVEAVIHIASAHTVRVVVLEEKLVRASFAVMSCTTREEIAAALARIFPELIWELPPKRKRWQSEHPRMTVFDAVALGLAYWHHPSKEPPSLWEYRSNTLG